LKTAGWSRSAVLLGWLAVAPAASATGVLTLEGDARAALERGRPAAAELHAVAAGLRHTFADRAGDRVVLYALAEARADLDERMFHELYARYKGPLGAWNVTAGRFRLPFGLLPGFTSERLLFPTLEERTLAFDADNGLMLSGQDGDWEYGLAATQGLGPHRDPEWPGPGLVTARVGLTRGESGEANVGLSVAAGRSREGHAMDMDTPRRLVALDATLERGRATARLEATAGSLEHRALATAYAGLDFAVRPRWEVNAAGSLVHREGERDGALSLGLGFRPSWLTIRGGYHYAYEGTPRHRLALQLYRLFALPY